MTVLYNWQQASEVLARLGPWLKPRLMAGHQYVLTVEKPKRSSVQNRRLHAMLSDIAKQVEWSGAKRDVDTWKRLVVAAWLRAEGEPVEFIPAIDGKGVDVIFERTSRMNKGQLSSLIEYVSLWGDSKGVEWSNEESA